MRIRSPKDFWAGLFFIAVGAGFIGLAQQYGMGNMHRMGPALFPTLVGVLLAGLGLVDRGARLRRRRPAGAALSRAADPRSACSPSRCSAWRCASRADRGGRRAGAGRRAGVAREPAAGEAVRARRRADAFSVAVFVWLLGLPIPLWPES